MANTKTKKVKKSVKEKKETKSKKKETKKKKSKKETVAIKTSKTKSKIKSKLLKEYYKEVKKQEDKLDVHSVNITKGSYVKNSLSSGILTYDLIMGGGFAPGSFIIPFGLERAGKSTLIYNGIAESARYGIINQFHDAETSTDGDYLDRIMKFRIGKDFTSLLPEFDDKGKLLNEPDLWYYQENIGERMFRFIRRTIKKLPDIKYIDGSWWAINPDNDDEYEEIESGKPQAIIFIDSLASMLPEAQDEDDESNPMAAKGRMFSVILPWVKSLLADKRVTMVATNQVRLKPGFVMGCLHGDTKIPLVDGRSFTIQEIVEKNIKGEVWSYNTRTKEIESKEIIDWHYNGEVDNQNEWISFKTSAVETKNGVIGFTCTKNHEVLTTDDWKKAHNIIKGDKLITKYKSIINKTLKEFLLGKMFADSSLVANTSSGFLRFQNNEQHDYLKWTIEKLENFYDFKEVDASNNRKAYISNSTRELYKWKKRIGNNRDLSKYFKDFSIITLAVIYMDDGCFDNNGSHCRGIFSFKRFKNNKDILDQISTMFLTFGYETNINYNDGSVRLNKENFLKFCSDVCKYIPQCMQYKLPDQFHNKYIEFSLTNKEVYKKDKVEVLDISIGSERKFRLKGKYDLSIKDNKNYIVGNKDNGVVVHNSPEYMPGGEAIKFYCMSGDTLLFTDKGIQTAQNISLQKSYKLLGESGLEKTSMFKYMGHYPTTTIKTKYGFSLTGRHNHRVLSVREGKPEFNWTSLDKLTCYDFVPIKTGSDVWSKTKPNINYKFIGQMNDNYQINVKYPKRISKHLARLSGYLVSEGFIKGNITQFSMWDKDVMKDFCECFKKVFGVDNKFIKKHLLKNNTVFSCGISKISQFLIFLGIGNKSSREKDIPWFILQSPKEYVKEFISALFEGDGSNGAKDVKKIKTNQINYASSSRLLSKQIHMVLLNFGIFSKYEDYKSTWFSKQDDRSKYGMVYLSGDAVFNFHNQIGFISKRKKLKVSGKYNYDFKNRHNILPNLVGWRSGNKAIKEWITSLATGKNGIERSLRLEFFTKEEYKIVENKIKTLKSIQEREATQKHLIKIKKFIKYTKDNNIIWVKIDKVINGSEPIAVYDGNNPETNTIITNGIVSHNSDQRTRFATCALSGISEWASFKKGKMAGTCEEKAWDGSGIEKYNFSKIKSDKNKKFAQFQEAGLRFCYESSGKPGYGVDPVFDVYMYYYLTGQCSKKGSGKGILKFDIKGIRKGKSFKSLRGFKDPNDKMPWKDFKKVIMNPKFKHSLYNYARKQMKSGYAFDLYFDNKQKAKVKEDDDE